MKKWALLLALLLVTMSTQAQTTLPASDWYAVAWIQETDTLHWINASGEQGSIGRPVLPAENRSANQTQLHVSPNGEMLVVTAPLRNQHEGIGFYDFERGQFIKFHETMDRETVVVSDSRLFTSDSAYFALVLRTPNTGAWRIIVFDGATGDAPYVLSHNPRTLAQAFVQDLSAYPQILAVSYDEATEAVDVRFQMINPNFPQINSYAWRSTPDYPEGSVRQDWLSFSANAGYDMTKSGRFLYTRIVPQYGIPSIPDVGNTISRQSSSEVFVDIVSASDEFFSQPRYLHNGDWVGYRDQSAEGDVHFVVADLADDAQVPLAPSFIDIHHTPDGFISRSDDNRLYHGTTLNTNGFGSFMDVIFESELSFSIIYSTPLETDFTLSGLASHS